MMKLSDIEIVLIEPKKGLLAFASFLLNDSICLSSIAIHSKLVGDGYRLTYPMKQGRYLFHPVSKEVSKLIEKTLINEFKNVMQQNGRYRCSFDT